jgi:hypothetical protein
MASAPSSSCETDDFVKCQPKRSPTVVEGQHDGRARASRRAACAADRRDARARGRVAAGERFHGRFVDRVQRCLLGRAAVVLVGRAGVRTPLLGCDALEEALPRILPVTPRQIIEAPPIMASQPSGPPRMKPASVTTPPTADQTTFCACPQGSCRSVTN